jgi:hypothetical protein
MDRWFSEIKWWWKTQKKKFKKLSKQDKQIFVTSYIIVFLLGGFLMYLFLYCWGVMFSTAFGG